MIGGDKTAVQCPECDETLVWWEFGDSGDQSDLGMGCENTECEGFEVQPDDAYSAIVAETERLIS